MLSKLSVLFIASTFAQELEPFTDLAALQQEDTPVNVDPDFFKGFSDIVLQNGFSFEAHPVTTDDGYILNIFRITKNDVTKSDAPVVFLQHGITDSADCWIMNFPDVAPAFQLVNEGYDVWLGNQRGTKYSMGHTSLDPKKDKAYWEFSFTEMGDHDAPAQIDFVRDRTGADKVTYIGHSQGTSQMFYGLSHQGDFWKERLNLFVSLAPVTNLAHSTSELFVYLSQINKELQAILNAFHIYSVLGDSVTSTAMKVTCGLVPQFCQFAEGFLITSDPSLDNPERFQVYMAHFPTGASIQSLIHYAQIIKAKEFQLFDWGSKSKNQEKYGQDTPPKVELGNIDLPTAMFVGTADDLGDKLDCEWARDQIPEDTLVHYEEIAAGHSTFMIGNDMSYFQNVLTLLEQYNPKQPSITDILLNRWGN